MVDLATVRWGEHIRVQKAPQLQVSKKPQSHGVSPHVARMVSSAEGRQAGTMKVMSGEEGCAGLAVVNAEWVEFLLHDHKGATIVVSSRIGHTSIFFSTIVTLNTEQRDAKRELPTYY